MILRRNKLWIESEQERFVLFLLMLTWEIADLRAQLAATALERDRLQQTLLGVQRGQSAMQAELQALQQELVSCQETYQALQSEHRQAHMRVSAQETFAHDNARLQGELQQLQHAVSASSREAATLRTSLQEAERLRSELQGAHEKYVGEHQRLLGEHQRLLGGHRMDCLIIQVLRLIISALRVVCSKTQGPFEVRCKHSSAKMRL
jgi:hypothetical protein